MRRKRARAAVVWDGGHEDFICRDERCTISEVHLVHDITDTAEVIAARRYFWGWSIDPFEPAVATRRPKPNPNSDRRLARPLHVQVLDECILNAISPYTVKPFRVLHDAVLGDYGSCEQRRLRRRLEALRREGRVGYISFDAAGMVAGYTTPTSPLLAEPWLVKEILWHQQSDYGEHDKKWNGCLPPKPKHFLQKVHGGGFRKTADALKTEEGINDFLVDYGDERTDEQAA